MIVQRKDVGSTSDRRCFAVAVIADRTGLLLRTLPSHFELLDDPLPNEYRMAALPVQSDGDYPHVAAWLARGDSLSLAYSIQPNNARLMLERGGKGYGGDAVVFGGGADEPWIASGRVSATPATCPSHMVGYRLHAANLVRGIPETASY